LFGRPLAWAMVFGTGLALAGCGSESPPPKTEAASTTPSTEVKKPGKVAAKGKGGLVEGGEMSAQDRRAAKLKAKQAGAQ
jgi:hypothetical protein